LSYNVELKWSGESAAGDQATRVYTVVSTTNTDTAVQIQNIAQIPNVGNIHPSNFWLRVKERPRITRLAPYYWEVTVNYEWAFIAAADPDAPTPLDEPTLVRFGFVGGDEPIDVDADGLPIMNTAYDVFEPGISIPTNDWYVEMVRNEAVFNVSTALAYKDAVNSDTFLGMPAGTWKIRGIEADQQKFGESLIYWRVTYTFDGRAEQAASTRAQHFAVAPTYTPVATTPPWHRRVRNVGMNGYLASGLYGRIVDDTGSPVPSPVPLNIAGSPDLSTSDPLFLSFQVYKEVPFAPLGLP